MIPRYFARKHVTFSWSHSEDEPGDDAHDENETDCDKRTSIQGHVIDAQRFEKQIAPVAAAVDAKSVGDGGIGCVGTDERKVRKLSNQT
jgi:hypothetical protein